MTNEQWEQDKALVLEAMRGILRDQEATIREKIFATLTIDDIITNTGVVPWRAKQLYENDVDISAFAHAVEKIAEEESKEARTTTTADV